MKRNKEVNKVVIEYFYRSKLFDEERKLIRGYRKRMLENGETEECLNQQSNVCVTRQGQSERTAGNRNIILSNKKASRR